MSESKSGGFSLPTIVFVVFLVLKLTHTIDWSWWAVTAPLWGSVALAIVWGLIVGAVIGIRAKQEAKDPPVVYRPRVHRPSNRGDRR